LTYIKVLSEWFDRRRGLVIGICMSGYGIGYVVVPMITRRLMDAYGWRGAYVGLGLLAIAAPLPAVISVMRDRPRDVGLHPDGATQSAARNAAKSGKTVAEALRMRELWMLAASFVLASFALNGAQSQIVPLLQGRGMPAFKAALMLSAIGFGSFPGRLLVGYLIDRVFAPYVTVVFYATSALGLFFLVAAIPDGAVMFCAIAIGLSLGAENDVLGFLTGRYFGLKHFGQIYGILFCAYLLGAAAGPYTMARAYVLTGTYRSALMAGIGAILLSSTLLLLLRKWPKTSEDE
jgi:sugar phosphate permease